MAEALIYLGVILALVAITALLGEFWEPTSIWLTLGLIGIVGIGFLAMGAYFHRSANPMFLRLVSFLWALSTGVAALWSGIFADQVLDRASETVFLVAATTGFLVALVLYLPSKRMLQVIALAIASCAVAISGVTYKWQDISTVGPALWGVWVAWLLLAWAEQLRPRTAACVLGSLIVLAAPAFLIPDFAWGESFGVLCAIGLLGVGILLRQLVLMGLGGLGVFIYVPMALFAYFGDVIAVPLVLLIISFILIGTALLILRLGSRFRARSLASPPAAGTPARQATSFLTPHRRATIAWGSEGGVLLAVCLLLASGFVATTPSYPSLADEPEGSLSGTIAYTATSNSGSRAMCVSTVAASGGEPEQVDCGDVIYGLAWTAEGQLLFARRGDNADRPAWEMVLWDVDSATAVKVVDMAQLDKAARREFDRLPTSVQPRTRSDGAVVKTASSNDGGVTVKSPNGDQREIISPDELAGPYPLVQWSPDGDRILVLDNNRRLLVVGATGEPGPRSLVETRELLGEPAWYIPGNPAYTVTMLDVLTAP